MRGRIIASKRVNTIHLGFVAGFFQRMSAKLQFVVCERQTKCVGHQLRLVGPIDHGIHPFLERLVQNRMPGAYLELNLVMAI